MLLVCVGCDRSQSQDTDEFGNPVRNTALISLIGYRADHPQWPGIVGGANAAVDQYPHLTLETAVAPVGDLAGQRPRLAEAVAHGADAVALWVDPNDPAELPLDWLQREGVKALTFGTAAPRGVQSVPHISIDLVGGAELLAKALPELMGSDRSFVLLHAQSRSELDDACRTRFLEEIRAHTAIHCLTQRDMHAQGRPGPALIREMLDEFRATRHVVALDPTPWLGAAPLKLPSDVRFAALGAAPALWPSLQNGRASALVGPSDGALGRLIVKTIALMLTKDGRPPLVQIVSCELYTPDNLRDRAAAYAQASGLDLADLLPDAAPNSAESHSAPAKQANPR